MTDITLKQLPDILSKISSGVSDKFKALSEQGDLPELAKLVGDSREQLQTFLSSVKVLEKVISDGAKQMTEIVQEQERQLAVLKESIKRGSRRPSPSSYLQAVSKDMSTYTTSKTTPEPVKYTPTLQLIEAAKNIKIPAYRVRSPQDAHKYKGDWCWHNGIFYLSVSGSLVSGRILNILPKKKTPYKVKEHRDAFKRTIDPVSTTYYVPRTEANPNSDDVRFLTGKMMYVSASEELSHDSICAMRIGSGDKLSVDIREIEAPDKRLYSDFTGHTLLCFTAMTTSSKQ